MDAPYTISIRQASFRLDICEATVRKLVRQGALQATRVGRRVLIFEPSVAAFLAERSIPRAS